MLNHIGTHVDAPSHLSADGDTLDEIALERLVCDAVTIDVSGARARPAAARRARAAPGAVRPGDLVLPALRQRARYGTDALLDRLVLPGRRRVAGAVDRGISGIGFDGPSADPVDTTGLRPAPDLARGRAADPREPRQPRPAAGARARRRRTDEGAAARTAHRRASWRCCPRPGRCAHRRAPARRADGRRRDRAVARRPGARAGRRVRHLRRGRGDGRHRPAGVR